MPVPPASEDAGPTPTGPPRRTMLVTNDFPPRQGGIQSFVHALAVRQPASELLVYCSDHDGSAGVRRAAAVPRHPARHADAAADPGGVAGGLAASRASTVRPRSGSGPRRRSACWRRRSRQRAGIERVVALTHGHEVGWAMLPVARQLLRRIGAVADVVTYLGEYTRRRLARVMGDLTALQRLAPGRGHRTFHPGVDGAPVRAPVRARRPPGHRLRVPAGSAQGAGQLIRALPEIRRRVPDAALLHRRGGPVPWPAAALAGRAGVAEHVVFTGAVPYAELPAYYAAGDVFAMPCRTRRFGLDVEGLGMVYLEASATGLPVVAGDSGGARTRCRRGRPATSSTGGDIPLIARHGRLAAHRPRAGRLGWAGPAGTGSSTRGSGILPRRDCGRCSTPEAPDLYPRWRTTRSDALDAGVQRGDLVGVLLHHDVALELQRRRELAGRLASSRAAG